MPKPVIAYCVPKLVAMATSLSTYEPPSNTIPTAHPSPQPKWHPYRFSRLCTDDRRVSLYFTTGRPFSPKNLPLLMGGSGPPSNTWFPGPTQVLNPKGSSIGAAVFAGLTSVTDRPTDHATRSVRIGRIYVRSTAMRPNNKKYHWWGIQPLSVSISYSGQCKAHIMRKHTMHCMLLVTEQNGQCPECILYIHKTLTRRLYCVECPQYSTRRWSASNIHRSSMLRKNR